MNAVDILIHYRQAFLHGIWVTLELSLWTWVIGISLGVIIGILGYRFQKTFGRAFNLIEFILSGIPFLVFLYWMHFPLQEMLDVVVDPFYTALIVLVILNTFSVASACRKALTDLPNEYIVTAKTCGLTQKQIIWQIQIPLVLRRVIPVVLTTQVGMLQLTLFASLISVEEIFRVALQVNSAIHKPVEIFTLLAIFFLLICLPLNGIAILLRRKYTRKMDEFRDIYD